MRSLGGSSNLTESSIGQRSLLTAEDHYLGSEIGLAGT